MNATTPPEYLHEVDDVATVTPTPWSQEAEQSVLGAVMLDNRAFDRCADVLQERSFWHASHRTIWAAIAGQVMANKPADPLTVFDALKARKQADECGGLPYLHNLLQSVASASNVRRYAEIVAERCAQRDTIAAADKALTIAREPGPIGEKLDRIATEFAGVQREQMRNAPRQLAELVVAACDRYSDMAEGRRSPAWATGIGPLDGILNGGLRPGKLYCLAARPSVGKSSAARAIGLNLAFGGHPVLLLSQEMPGDEVADCAIAQLGGIESDRLQTGRLAASDWTGVTNAAEQISHLPFWVDDDGGLNLNQIRGKARAVKGLRVLVVDYLQLSTSTLRNASTNDQVAEISKGLKQLALQMGIAVIVLSQLNREVEKRADREPQLSDLRDSGAIEQDIDAAVMLWTVREPSDGPRLVGWKVPKHRGGRKGRFGMWFDAPVYAWTDAPGELPPPGSTGRAAYNSEGIG
jgi:replicative DNA helicase